MSSAQPSVDLVVRIAWWLPLYVHGLAFVAALTGMEPDWAKVERVVARAIKVQVKRGGSGA